MPYRATCLLRTRFSCTIARKPPNTLPDSGYVESLPDCFVQEVTDDDFLADIRIGDAAATAKTTNLTIHKAVYTVPQNIRMKDWAMVMPDNICLCARTFHQSNIINVVSCQKNTKA